MNKHIHYTIRKLSYIVYKLKKLANIINEKYLNILYHALEESHLTYGLMHCESTNTTLTTKLEKYKSILKAMYQKPQTYLSKDIFWESAVLNLSELYAKIMLLKIFTKKINHQYLIRHKINCYLLSNLYNELTMIHQRY